MDTGTTDDRDFDGLPESMLFGHRFRDNNCPICGLKLIHQPYTGCVGQMIKYLALVQEQAATNHIKENTHA